MKWLAIIYVAATILLSIAAVKQRKEVQRKTKFADVYSDGFVTGPSFESKDFRMNTI